MKTCTVDGCPLPHRARGLCSTHYNLQRYGADRHRTQKTCQICGAEYVTTRTNGRFCSLLCRDLWRVDQPDDPMWSLHRHRRPKKKTAPTACRVAWSICPLCGNDFPHQPGPRTYCSRTCRQRVSNRAKTQARKGRRKIRRHDIFERDGYICWLCDLPCDRTLSVPHPLAPTVDHLVPRVHGGDDEPDNLATAHFQCNSVRGASWSVPLDGHAA